MHPQTLPHAQIQHNLLTPTRNSISPNISIQPLNLPPLSTTTIAQSPKYLARLARTVLERRSRLRLQTCDCTAELQHGFSFFHVLTLIDDVLEPVVAGFDLAGHVREFEADDGVVDEALAEGFALVGIFDGFFITDTGEADALDYDADALVVEVGHDYW